MVLNNTFCAILVCFSAFQIACNPSAPPLDMALAEEALQTYCTDEGVSPDIFQEAKIYREKKYDWCVEFVTKTNAPRQHVLLLFFRGQRIVERHRMRDPGLGDELMH